MQALVPSYLEMSLEGFARQRERMQKEFSGAFVPTEAIDRFQDQVRQNLQLFDRAMKMFSPFAYARSDAEDAITPASAPPQPPAPPAQAPAAGSDEALTQLKAQVEAMQRQIEKLVTKP